MADRIRARVGELVGCDPAAVLLHSSHTHAAPWPGATTAFRGKRVLLVRSQPEVSAHDAEPGTLLDHDEHGVRVACAEGALRVTHIKPEGRAELTAVEWARGARPRSGERFEELKELTT